MRILSLFDLPEKREVYISYVSKDSREIGLVNGIPTRIIAVTPGEDKPESGNILYITLPEILDAKKGYFICVEGDDAILKIREIREASLELAVVKAGFIEVSKQVNILRPMSVGILTVSDKGSRGERIDTAGPALAEEAVSLGSDIIVQKIVPDEKKEIISTLTEWTDSLNINLILLTGGTGLSPRDITPEALKSLAHKEVPGFGEKMRMQTSTITERAILSRSIAVTRGKTLLIAFPGSHKGAVECFQAIAPVVRHAVEIICGWGGECGSSHS